nr:hypothetical protein [Tanacetum cinerariifolium]
METRNIQNTDVLFIRARKNLHQAFKNFNDFERFRASIVSTQVVFAAKLPILNHNDFDLWKMRIEQYLLMTDYSLWEVILNGDSPSPTRVIEGVVQPVAHTTVEQSLPTEWRTHTLIWRNKTDLEEQSLDDLFNSLKIYEAKSTNEPVSIVASVSATSATILVSALPNTDTLRDGPKWQMAMLTIIARRFFQRTGKHLKANGHTSMGFDMSKVECYNCHKKGHFTRKCRSPKDTRRNVTTEPQRRHVPVETSTSNVLVSQYDGVGSYEWSFHAKEEPTNYVIMAFTSLSSFSSDNENLSQLLASQTNDKTRLGYNNQVFTSAMIDCDEIFSSETAKSLPGSPIYDRYHPGEGPSVMPVENSILAANPKTDIPKPQANGNSRNRKASFVCKSLTHLIKDCDYYEKQMFQTLARHHAKRGNSQHYTRMSLPKHERHVVPTTILTKSKLVPLTAARPVTTAVPQPHVTRPRQSKTVVTKSHSPPRRNINLIISPKHSNFPLKVITLKVSQVNAVKGVQGKWEWKPKCLILDHDSRHTSNPHHALKDKGVIDSGCSRYMTRNMSYLSNFKEINGGYIAFGGNPKGGKITGKGKIRTGSGPTWLFNIDTLTKTMNYQPITASNQSNPSTGVQEQFDAKKVREDNVQQYVIFPLRSSGYKNPHKTDDDAAFEVKEPEFKGKKHESEVHVSPSSSAKTKKHNDKTTKVSKGKSHVELSTGYRNLKLEDITYSDDEDDVGAEADFTNLETNITVSHIPKTRVHKDHPVTQILGRLSLGTQTRSMTRVAKDQGGLSQEELLQFKMQKVWVLVDLPNENRVIGHTQEEGIDYEEVFAPVARIEPIRLFLAYASFMGFMVYQMDVKSAFMYGTIEEEVYVFQPLRFEDPNYPDKVYKVVKALYGLH